MRIISISTDENLLLQNSRVYFRVQEYSKMFDEYICLVFTKNKKFKVIQEGNFKVVPVYGRNKLMQVRRLLDIFETSDKGNIKNTWLSSQDAFEVGLICCHLKERFGYKLLVQMHTDISTHFFKQESLRNYFQYYLSKRVLNEADSIRVVSSKMSFFLHAVYKIPHHKIHLLPIHSDITQYKFIQKHYKTIFDKSEKINVLMISRIEEVKNIPLGVKSVQAFRKLSGRDVRLKIVGDGSLRYKYLKRFKDKDWIEWGVWSKDVEKEYHNADVLLVTSNYEGWGLTAVESVACGTPVVISPVGVANEFIQNGINGFVARGHDVINICEALYNCMTHHFNESSIKKSLDVLDDKKTYLEKFKETFT